ncbi:MAG: tetratricopeptide repeat protein, partial [Oscillospiraceae bacterium]
MFCIKCGSELPDNVSFCGVCGAKIELDEKVPADTAAQAPAPTETPAQEAVSAASPAQSAPKDEINAFMDSFSQPQAAVAAAQPALEENAQEGKFNSKRNKIIIIAAALLAVASLAFAGVSVMGRSGVSAGLSLAYRYLAEQNYEQAVIEYRKVLKIDPKNVEAYLGLADALTALDRTDEALEALQKGFDITGDNRLLDKIDEIKNLPGEQEIVVVIPEETVEETVADEETVEETVEEAETVPVTEMDIINIGNGAFATRTENGYAIVDERLSTLAPGRYTYISPFWGSAERYVFASTTWNGKDTYSAEDTSFILNESFEAVNQISGVYNVWWSASGSPFIVTLDHNGYHIAKPDGTPLGGFVLGESEIDGSIPAAMVGTLRNDEKYVAGSTGSTIMITDCDVVYGTVYFSVLYTIHTNGEDVIFEHSFTAEYDGNALTYTLVDDFDDDDSISSAVLPVMSGEKYVINVAH